MDDKLNYERRIRYSTAAKYAIKLRAKEDYVCKLLIRFLFFEVILLNNQSIQSY